MLVHFHNETKIRDYNTTDWEELAKLIEDDVGDDRGIEKITYKKGLADPEIDLDKPTFDNLLVNGQPQGVFIVYFSVRRSFRYHNDTEVQTVFAPDFESFVQQIEQQAGTPVQKIVYTIKAPNGKEIEFEVGEDTFSELPTVTFVAYLEGEVEEEIATKIETLTVHIDGQAQPVTFPGDLSWNQLVAEIAEITPKQRVSSITYPRAVPNHKPEEVEVNEYNFDSIPNKHKLVLKVHLANDESAPPVPVQFPGETTVRKFVAHSYFDLVRQIEQASSRQVKGLSYEVKGPKGVVIPCQLDDISFPEVAEAGDIVVQPSFSAISLSKARRVLVQYPGEKFPMNLKVSEYAELVEQVQATLDATGSALINITYNTTKDGKEVENVLTRDGFNNIDPDTILHVHSKSPYLRLVTLPGDSQPRSIFARTYNELIDAINDELPENKEIASVVYKVVGPKGQQVITKLDDQTWEDVFDDASIVFDVRVLGYVNIRVLFPEEKEPKSFTAKTYSDLVKTIEAESAVMVGKLTYTIDNQEVVLNEASFNDLPSKSLVRVQFKELPTLSVQLPGKAPMQFTVAEYDELVDEIRKLAVDQDVDKLVYTPKGQQKEVVLNDKTFEDVANDPAGHVIKAVLQPLPPLFKLVFNADLQSVNIRASTNEEITKEAIKAAGGRVVDNIQIKGTPLASSPFPPAGSDILVNLKPPSGQWLTICVRFPFEPIPRKISGAEFEGIMRELNKQAPTGFLKCSKLTLKTTGPGKKVIEQIVDEAVLEDIEDPSTTFVAHFERDPKARPPCRLVHVEGIEQPHKVFALYYDDFIEAVKEIYPNRPLHGITYEAIPSGKKEMPINLLTPEIFIELPLTSEFWLQLGKAPTSNGVFVKYPHRPDIILIPAHTYQRMMHLIHKEAKAQQEKVEKVTYSVPGPCGQTLELEDLDEEVFNSFEDLEAYTFRVYYEGKPRGFRLVQYPSEEEPQGIIANTYAEFIQAILDDNPDQPGIELITYEVPGPKGRTVTFTLTEDAWDELYDLPETVFTVKFPEPTNELNVLFPWNESPVPVAAPTFADLLKSIECSLPGDQALHKLTYLVEGPKGKLEIPLDQRGFDDIEDADTVIKVFTRPAKAISVLFPPQPVAWPSTYQELLTSIQKRAASGRKIKNLLYKSAEGPETLLDEAGFAKLSTLSDVALRVVYE